MGVFLKIILWILKLLGILLLVVLGVVVLILLAPIRYEVSAEADDQKKVAKGRVTWLLRALNVRFWFEGEFAYSVKILGIQILPGKPDLKEPEAMEEEPKPEITGPVVATPLAEEIPVTEQQAAERPVEDPVDRQAPPPREPEKEPLLDKLRAFWVKVQEIGAMVKDKGNQTAVKHAFREIGYIIKKIMPQSLRAMGVVGFADPSTTGKMAGVLAMLMPFYKDAVQIEPDFEQQRIEGVVTLKGHIRLGIFIVAAVRLMLDKSVRRLIKQVLDMVESNKGGIKNGRKQ